jgi:hypothetical protein
VTRARAFLADFGPAALIVVAIFGALFMPLLVGCQSDGGTPNASPTTASTAGDDAERLAEWRDTVGTTALGDVEAAITETQTAAGQRATSALATACTHLTQAAERAAAVPPPVESIAVHWAPAMDNFADGGRLCARAVAADDGPGIAAATAVLDGGTKEITAATKAVNAVNDNG